MDYKQLQDELRETKFKPFEKRECPITKKLEELDPVSGFSLDGIATKVRRGELQMPLGWGLNPRVGFETRFHSKKVSNITFRVLHPGFTKGSMLVNFSEDELWMRNLGQDCGEIDFGGSKVVVQNLWKRFLFDVVDDVTPVYTPTQREGDVILEDEWYSFLGNILVNGKWLSFRPPTIAGCVVDVPNFSGEGAAEYPCDIPISLRDFDYLYTKSLLDEYEGDGIEQVLNYLCSNFFKDGKPTIFQRLIDSGAKFEPGVAGSYLERGHGLLGMLKGEREALGIDISIPQLELRDEPVHV